MTDLFQADQPNTTTPQVAPQQPGQSDADYAAYLQAIVNDEGKPKYNSVEEALKGAANAQEYIRQLKSQLSQLEQQAAKGAAINDVMDAIKNQQSQGADQPSKSLGEEDVSAMFQKLLSKAKEDEIKAANESKFSEAIKSAYGDKAKDFIGTKAKELGINTSLLQEMAQTSPVAALQLLGVTGQQPKNSTNKSTVNTVGFNTGAQQNQQRTYNMGAGTTKDLVAEWRRCQALVNNH